MNIKDIDIETKEGRLLVRAIGLICASRQFLDKTPEEVLGKLEEIENKYPHTNGMPLKQKTKFIRTSGGTSLEEPQGWNKNSDDKYEAVLDGKPESIVILSDTNIHFRLPEEIEIALI